MTENNTNICEKTFKKYSFSHSYSNIFTNLCRLWNVISFAFIRNIYKYFESKKEEAIYVDYVLRDMTNLIGKGHIDMTVSPNQKP